eukprot:5293067-Alexandrium_andersonii.AAC.1
MSASLVGSEMCIRDRTRGLPGERLSDGECASTPRFARGLPTSPPVRAAVSYTHLTLPTICSV